MFTLVLIIHVIVCLVLIFVVLLQAGRGGGFSEMVGGGQPSTIFGTQSNEFMVKATEVCAVLFLITSLSLGLLTSHKNRSLMANRQARVVETTKEVNTAAADVKSEDVKEVAKQVEQVAAEIPNARN